MRGMEAVRREPNKQGVNEKEIDLDIVLQLKKILDEDDHNIRCLLYQNRRQQPYF